MIKFIKEKGIKICTTLLVIVFLIFCYHSIASSMVEEEQKYQTVLNGTYEIKKENVKDLIKNINNTLSNEGISAHSTEALANIEYLKLEQLEKIANELENLNETLKEK